LVKTMFKTRTGMDYDAGTQTKPITQAQAEPGETKEAPKAPQLSHGVPKTFEDFAAQQESLKPAVEAQGWRFDPEMFNYSVGKNGKIEREPSAGRAYIKYYWDSIHAEMERQARDKDIEKFVKERK